MPIYEYVAKEDGKVIEVMRPMADADKPVADPEGKNRTFERKHSTFAAQGGSQSKGVSLPMSGGGGGGCGCGRGGCGAH